MMDKYASIFEINLILTSCLLEAQNTQRQVMFFCKSDISLLLSDKEELLNQGLQVNLILHFSWCLKLVAVTAKMKPARKEENGSCGRQKVDSELQVSFAIVRCMLYRTDLRGNQNTSTSSTDIIFSNTMWSYSHHFLIFSILFKKMKKIK